jgi:hypothetical protein
LDFQLDRVSGSEHITRTASNLAVLVPLGKDLAEIVFMSENQVFAVFHKQTSILHIWGEAGGILNLQLFV